MYQRIATETKNKIRFEKAIAVERKKKEVAEKKSRKISEAKRKEQETREAQRQLDIEMRHQNSEAETRALGRAMMSDAQENRPSLNRSCLNLLNNYQGKKIIFHILRNNR